MYAAAANLSVLFFPSTILLYRQFILQSSNALPLVTAQEINEFGIKSERAQKYGERYRSISPGTIPQYLQQACICSDGFAWLYRNGFLFTWVPDLSLKSRPKFACKNPTGGDLSEKWLLCPPQSLAVNINDVLWEALGATTHFGLCLHTNIMKYSWKLLRRRRAPLTPKFSSAASTDVSVEEQALHVNPLLQQW